MSDFFNNARIHICSCLHTSGVNATKAPSGRYTFACLRVLSHGSTLYFTLMVCNVHHTVTLQSIYSRICFFYAQLGNGFHIIAS